MIFKLFIYSNPSIFNHKVKYREILLNFLAIPLPHLLLIVILFCNALVVASAKVFKVFLSMQMSSSNGDSLYLLSKDSNINNSCSFEG